MTVVFDKNIPVPAPHKGVDKRQKYRKYAGMGVGDSVFILEETKATRSSAISGIKYANGPTTKVVTRAVVENGIAGVRVWRTA